ncbi:MAG: ATP-dependent DNA ligase [Candidatus Aenigmatarchaeota archaeon]
MKYQILTDYYEKLEKTSKKLEKTDIIAELLKKTSHNSINKVVRLIRGSVFPEWSDEEMGVADKLMIKAIAKAYGASEREVVNNFKKTGDLGTTAEYLNKLKRQRTLGKKELTINKVFEDMEKIAKQSGAGSQERKLNLIAGLLSNAKPKESIYIVRTVLGQLRVGVAGGILRDAIAKAFKVDAREVERAWSLYPDYGEVARILKKKGKRGISRIGIELGKPMRLMLAIKSPDLKTALKDAKNPAIEYKYDGMRTQIHKKGSKIWLFTRRLENVTKQFPDLVKLCKECIKAKECIIEGELLGIDPKTKRPLPFQKLSQRIHRKYDIGRMTKEIPIEMNLFDITYLNGKLYFNEPLKTRLKALEKIIKVKKGKFQIAARLETKNYKKAEEFYKKSLKAGHEGVVVKNLNAHYRIGRHVGHWWKVKPELENLDLTIIGATWGTGKRTGWLGSFVLGCKKGSKYVACGMLGTGVKEKAEGVTFKQLTKMLKPYIISEKGNKVKIRPHIVIEVAYGEIQKSPNYESGFALRFPRFIRLRPDKSVKQVDSVIRIKHLYNIQKGKK